MGSPGPATISLAGIGTAFGFKKGIPYLLGIILGTFGVLLMIATGLTALLLAQPLIVTVLTIVAAIYILYLAWKIASATVGTSNLVTEQVPSFISGCVLALSNPKAFAAIGAVYSGHVLISDSFIGDSIAKIAALTIVIVIVNASWLMFGSSFSKILNDPKKGKVINVIFALMLVISVALALIGN